MELALRPDRLDLDPQMPGAEGEFAHWLTCFLAYLRKLKASSDEEKLEVLTSRVSPRVYAMFRDHTNYGDAMNALRKQY